MVLFRTQMGNHLIAAGSVRNLRLTDQTKKSLINNKKKKQRS